MTAPATYDAIVIGSGISGGWAAKDEQQGRATGVRVIDAEAQRVGTAHDFALLRELAERAYLSSEVGMMRALRYVRVPGHWSGCVPLAPGQPAWG